MLSQNAIRQLRSCLSKSSNALPPSGVLELVDDFVNECRESSEREQLSSRFEDDLQRVHQEFVDHRILWPTELFLSVLCHLNPVLPPVSIIANWFDVLLRPALRTPKLGGEHISDAKKLIIYALSSDDQRYSEKIKGFRRRLLDLYLRDAYNDSSGEEVLEWAELDEAGKESSKQWKANLEDLLVQSGRRNAMELFNEIHDCFAEPSHRLQLLLLLNILTSKEWFNSQAAILASHPLTSRILLSLILDNSSTVFSTALTVIVKLLPLFAVQASAQLKQILPELMAVLARLICWKSRTPPAQNVDMTEIVKGVEFDKAIDDELYIVDSRHAALEIRAELSWQRLELSFDGVESYAPTPMPYFTFLYYLLPCNVLMFLRMPTPYLERHSLPSPYTVGWAEALDDTLIKTRSQELLRSHILHPAIIWRDADQELSERNFWFKTELPQIASEATMLELRNAKLGSYYRHPEQRVIKDSSIAIAQGEGYSAEPQVIQLLTPVQTSERFVLSIDDMVNTSVALKSGLNVDIAPPSTSWANTLFPDMRLASTTSRSPSVLPVAQESVSSQGLDAHEAIPIHVKNALASLQREVFLLRNELNFELWLSRENVKHIGRLYQDRISGKRSEAERLSKYANMRKFRNEATQLRNELHEAKDNWALQKQKAADWNTALQERLERFRKEQKSSSDSSAQIQNAHTELKAQFEAQSKLLAEALAEIFSLKTYQKENQHKIDRLHDYERQHEQHLNMEKLWDADCDKFSERGDQLNLLIGEMRKLQLRLETYERSQEDMEGVIRTYRRQIAILEAKLALATKAQESQSNSRISEEVAKAASEKAALQEANRTLQDRNDELHETNLELQAMIEVLRHQEAGLIKTPRASPLTSPIVSHKQPSFISRQDEARRVAPTQEPTPPVHGDLEQLGNVPTFEPEPCALLLDLVPLEDITGPTPTAVPEPASAAAGLVPSEDLQHWRSGSQPSG